MALARAVVLLLLVAGIVCFVLYLVTGETRWRTRGIAIVRWTVVAGLVFFGVLIAERLVELR